MWILILTFSSNKPGMAHRWQVTRALPHPQHSTVRPRHTTRKTTTMSPPATRGQLLKPKRNPRGGCTGHGSISTKRYVCTVLSCTIRNSRNFPLPPEWPKGCKIYFIFKINILWKKLIGASKVVSSKYTKCTNFQPFLALVLMLAYGILQPRRLHFLLLQQKDEVNWVVVHQHFSLNNRQNGV